MVELARRSSCVLSILLLALGPIACAPGDPMAKVAAAREDYEAQLSGWIVRPQEPPAEIVTTEGEGEGEDGNAGDTDDEAPGEDMAPIEIDPRSQVVLFDLIVLYSGNDPLPGVTVDISHVGGDGVEKAVRKQYLELPNIRRGATEQVDFELDGWDLADGDSFAVEVTRGVSESDRGAYREFQEAGG